MLLQVLRGQKIRTTILQLLVFYACFLKSISITLFSTRYYVSFRSSELLLFLCGLSELGGKSFLVEAMLLQALCALGGNKFFVNPVILSKTLLQSVIQSCIFLFFMRVF